MRRRGSGAGAGEAAGGEHYYPSTALAGVDGARGAVLIVGPRGCGRTSAAREVARRRGAGWCCREFGKQDYLAAGGLRRALRALSARRGGGVLVQMGAASGTVAVFDDLDTAPRAVQRLLTKFMAGPAPRSLLAVGVATAMSGVSGMRWLAKSPDARTVRLARPTDAQILRLVRAGGGGGGGGAAFLASLGPDARADFRAVRAAWDSRGAALAAGSGQRDAVWDDRDAADLARDALLERCPATRARVAASAPLGVGALYAANAAKLLPGRAARACYARGLSLSARCRAVAFDDLAGQFALVAGTLAVPMLRPPPRRRTAKGPKLVGAPTLSLQARYQNAQRKKGATLAKKKGGQG